MKYLYVAFGVILVGYMVASASEVLTAAMYGIGGALAVAIVVRDQPTWLLRSGAIASTVVMFYFSFKYLAVTPFLEPDWYWQRGSIPLYGYLVGSFVMIFVLSAYSSPMKDDCAEGVTDLVRRVHTALVRLLGTRQQDSKTSI